MNIIEKEMYAQDVERAVNRVVEAFQFSQHLGTGKLYVAFSGGKDSVAVYGVCKKAAEKLGIELLDMCEFHYNITNVDPPELVLFIKKQFPFVERHRPVKTMWQLIVEKSMPPTRLVRYCCAELKEKGGRGRFCITGVRWAESARRKNTRSAFEDIGKNAKSVRFLFEDNEEDRRELEHCIPKEKYVCNPIVDWSDEQVWNFIHTESIPYCSLYDEGFKRLGCIGCPMAGNHRIVEFERWPKYKDQYIRTFQKMVDRRKEKGMDVVWKTGQEVFDWWMDEKKKEKDNPDQLKLF